jgi:hypothetical protein
LGIAQAELVKEEGMVEAGVEGDCQDHFEINHRATVLNVK